MQTRHPSLRRWTSIVKWWLQGRDTDWSMPETLIDQVLIVWFWPSCCHQIRICNYCIFLKKTMMKLSYWLCLSVEVLVPRKSGCGENKSFPIHWQLDQCALWERSGSDAMLLIVTCQNHGCKTLLFSRPLLLCSIKMLLTAQNSVVRPGLLTRSSFCDHLDILESFLH